MNARRDRITLRRAAELAASVRHSVIRAHQVRREDHAAASEPSYPYLVGSLGVTLEHLVRDLGGREAMALVAAALDHKPTEAELAMNAAELDAHCQPAALHRPQRRRVTPAVETGNQKSEAAPWCSRLSHIWRLITAPFWIAGLLAFCLWELLRTVFFGPDLGHQDDEDMTP